MQIKRFEAKNMTDALRQIKRVLGPEAVILSAKDLRRENRLLGISRKIGVEVTAAVDEDYPGARHSRNNPEPLASRGEKQPASTHGAVSDGVRSRMNSNLRLKALAAHVAGRYQTTDKARRSSANGAKADEAATDNAQAIVKQEIDPTMGRYLSKSGLSVGAVRLNENGPTLISLVGNAGVGKTATLAKLAATYKYTQGLPVGLLSLDGLRIGGNEQLQCFADSMQLPLALSQTEKDLNQAVERLKQCGIILIDTPALNPGDKQRLPALQSQFMRLGDVQPLLVVSAESREEDLNNTLHRYAPVNPVGIVITKTDLTGSYADLVNFLCRRSLAVYFYSTGPRVPFDLKKASIENLADRFLSHDKGPILEEREEAHPSTGGTAQGHEVSGTYLANKNSDIFHRPECKWSRLINRSNIVEFRSFAEALNHRFKPCRYCNPQHLSITGILSRERAAL
jgi:flagellar biosynthesis protein FlhF